jgi:hypothetical protein
MSNLAKAEEIANRLRQEPHSLFRNDCITKSMRFKRKCRAVGIQASVVVCMGLARAKWFGHWLVIPVIHGWAEAGGKRLETSRPLGSSGTWGIVPMNIKPIIGVRF